MEKRLPRAEQRKALNRKHLRVSLAINFVSPYRIPLYAALAKTPSWELQVFSSCEMEFDRLWNRTDKFSFQYKRSFNISYKRIMRHVNGVPFDDVRQVHFPLGLWFDLRHYRPDVIISGELGARSLVSAIYARLVKKPVILWFYGTPHTERDISRKQRVLRTILCRMSNAFIGMGGEARRYLESIRVPSESIFDAKNAVDMTPFLSNLPEENRSMLREKLGISGVCYLYVGRLVPRKGLNYLIDAWRVFCNETANKTSLVLVGDGEEKENLRNKALSLQLSNIHFMGFVPHKELPSLYHAADVFVFPTLEDVWGLVVNEAMSSGLPVICSKYAGCAPDLILEGRNGWVVDPLNVEDLIEKLKMAWDVRNKKETMGRIARELITNVDISGMVRGFQEAVDYALFI